MFPSKAPVAELTAKLQPTAVVKKGYWVDNDGNQVAAAGVRAKGIAFQNFSQSEVDSNTAGTNPPAQLTVIQFGPTAAILGNTVGDKTFVTVDATGRTIAATTANHEILGWIEKGGAVGDEREIFILRNDNHRIPAAAIASLTGAGSGTPNGSLVAEGTVSTAGGNTYADAAVNTVFGKIEDNIAEIAAKLEAALVALRAHKIIAP